MRSSDELLREFYQIRATRNRLRRERGACFCLRAEPVTRQDFEDAAAERQSDPLATFEFPEPTQPEACWKHARTWEETDYRARFYFDPPQSEWCEPCRRRQELTEAYREAVRRHGGALRGLLRRGKALSGEAPQAVAVATDSEVIRCE